MTSLFYITASVTNILHVVLLSSLWPLCPPLSLAAAAAGFGEEFRLFSPVTSGHLSPQAQAKLLTPQFIANWGPHSPSMKQVPTSTPHRCSAGTLHFAHCTAQSTRPAPSTTCSGHCTVLTVHSGNKCCAPSMKHEQTSLWALTAAPHSHCSQSSTAHGVKCSVPWTRNHPEQHPDKSSPTQL